MPRRLIWFVFVMATFDGHALASTKYQKISFDTFEDQSVMICLVFERRVTVQNCEVVSSLSVRERADGKLKVSRGNIVEGIGS